MPATGMCFIPAKQLGVRWQDLLKFIDVRQGRPSPWRTGWPPPPQPVPGLRGSWPQRDWRAERGRAEQGGFLRERTRGTSVDLQSHRTAGKCEWMTSWPHTCRLFTPPYGTAAFESCRNDCIYEMNATAVSYLWENLVFFEARFSELATCQLKNHGGGKLILSIFLLPIFVNWAAST